MNSKVETTVAFLREIGLVVDWVSGASGFVPGVRILNGAILVDRDCLVSNLLHEAGHVAIVPGRFRPYLSDDLDVGMKRMFEEINHLRLDPDAPLMRAALQCSDTEATAWAWSAGIAIGLQHQEIILDEEYDGEGEYIRTALQCNSYLGINGLAHAGMCCRAGFGTKAPRFPTMIRWLQQY